MEGRIVGRLVQEGFDSTLSTVAKVWADLLLGHTFPPGRIGHTSHRQAEITSPGTSGLVSLNSAEAG